MLEYEWRIKVPSEKDLKDYQSDNALMAAALYNRGIDLEKARTMVADPYPGLTKPLNIINRNKAVELIHRFIMKDGGQIYIFADYDADGISSAAIAIQCLNYFHAILRPDEEWTVYCNVPERENGYGLSKEWCQKLADSVSSEQAQDILVITVDNGITKKDAVDILQNNGITVLITDHHRPDFENNATPQGCICVDPYIDDRRIGINLAGCGVIFNLLRYYEDIYIGDHSVTDQYIYLVAIGTIGDVMNMNYYHGCIIAWAIQQINSDQCPEWLQEVLQYMKIENVTAKTIGFNVAPFLNACGQAGKANLALDIILEPDTFQREPLLQEAWKLYNTVKTATKDAKLHAEEEIKETGADQHTVIIYGFKTDFPGIVGKVAYHLSEITNKPVICYNDKGEDIIKGSGRNINDSIPFYDLLKTAQRENIIISANGHTFAMGCEFSKEQVPMLLDFMDDIIGSMVRTGKSTLAFKKELIVDKIITPDDITMQNVRAIECFPFTNDWKEPSLCILNVELVSVHSSSNNAKNVCYTVHDSNGNDIEFWTWNIRPNSYKPEKHTKISLIGTLSRDFRKERQPMFNVTDFKLA